MNDLADGWNTTVATRVVVVGLSDRTADEHERYSVGKITGAKSRRSL
jgi:hypothetical protein